MPRLAPRRSADAPPLRPQVPGENGCKCGGKSKPGAAEQSQSHSHSHVHDPPAPPAAQKKSCSSSTSGGASSAAMEQLETRYLGGTSGVKRGDLEFVHALGLERQPLKSEAFLDVDALLRDAHADGGDGLVFSEEELL